jgi:histone H3/H4
MTSDINGNDVQLSKRNVKNIMHSVNDRVSNDAATYLAYELERQVTKVTRAAHVIARADGRETIREDDIRRAREVHNILLGDG